LIKNFIDKTIIFSTLVVVLSLSVCGASSFRGTVNDFYLKTFFGKGKASAKGQGDIPFAEREVGLMMLMKSTKYGLNPKMVYAIASVESDFEPLAIAVETSKPKADVLRKLASKNIRVRIGKTYHSKINLVSLYPDSYKTAVFIINNLERLGFTFDVGLMQVNTCNFNQKEVRLMLDPEANLEKASKHLKGCVDRYSSTKLQVECYNRGAGNLNRMLKKGGRYFPYWKRYKKHYYKYFNDNVEPVKSRAKKKKKKIKKKKKK